MEKDDIGEGGGRRDEIRERVQAAWNIAGLVRRA